MRTDSLAAFGYAARPRTLTGAVAPVLVALAMVHDIGSIRLAPALLCLAFAVVMQVAANYINDLFDCLRGHDAEGRIGPPRACQEGWVTPRAMKHAVGITVSLGVVIGLALLAYTTWHMLFVGAACLLFSFLYTTSLASKALGDVLVIVFFGLVPVCCTFYIQTDALTSRVIWTALGMGLATDLLLQVNNIRDIRQDTLTGKRTLAVVLGFRMSRELYGATGVAAVACVAHPDWTLLLWLPYLAMHAYITRHLHGSMLPKTSASIMLYALTTILTSHI